METYESGIVLRGSEVKSLRDAKVQMRDAYARVERRGILLLGVLIAPYGFAHGFGAHIPTRPENCHSTDGRSTRSPTNRRRVAWPSSR